MQVLITGGTGFIGSRLALRCLEDGHAVRVLGQRNTEAEIANADRIEERGAEVMIASVTSKEEVRDAMQGVDTVFHLAAAQHEANVPDQHFYDVNVGGTKNVLDAAADAGVGQFVHGSSIGVYGSAIDGTLDESSQTNPDNIYGITKLEGENLALTYNGRLPVSVIRISEAYGPGDMRLLRLFRAIAKQKFFMIGKGENLHHPIYIDDLLDGILLSAATKKAAGQIFVLPGKEAVTTNQLVGTIAGALNTKFPRIRAPLFPFVVAATIAVNTLGRIGIQPPLHPRRMDFFRKSFVFADGRAASVLGFAPKYDFQEGVNHTAKWYSEMGYI